MSILISLARIAGYPPKMWYVALLTGGTTYESNQRIMVWKHHAKTREECEVALTDMIAAKKKEIAEMKAKAAA